MSVWICFSLNVSGEDDSVAEVLVGFFQVTLLDAFIAKKMHAGAATTPQMMHGKWRIIVHAIGNRSCAQLKTQLMQIIQCQETKTILIGSVCSVM